MNKKTANSQNQKQEPELSEENPWALKIWRIAIAKKFKGEPAVQWADGYVKLSDRVFWKHQIKVRDIVQIRSGWNENATGLFGEVEEIILETAKLAVPVPDGGGSKILKMKNVPAGALMRIGKAKASITGNVRRNPLRAQRKAKNRK